MAQYTVTQPENVQVSFPAPGGVTPGLEGLLGATHMLVKQKKEMVEIFTGWEANNRYEIYNQDGQIIFYAVEQTSTFARLCLGQNRPFTIRIFDAQQREMIVLDADINCCTQSLVIQVPAGQQVAMIHKEFALMAPSFFIKDNAGAVMFKIKSPLSAAIGSFGNVKFDVFSSDQQTVVGQISKQWGGLAKEMFTRADVFGISVPADLDVTWKAVLLAAVFHIDFAFYQHP